MRTYKDEDGVTYQAPPLTIKITLSSEESIALAKMARRECRLGRNQAKYLILEALRAKGYLKDTPEDEEVITL